MTAENVRLALTALLVPRPPGTREERMLKRLWALPTLPTLTAGCLYLCVCVCVCARARARACLCIHITHMCTCLLSPPGWLLSGGGWVCCGVASNTVTAAGRLSISGRGREGSSSQRRQAHLLPQRLGQGWKVCNLRASDGAWRAAAVLAAGDVSELGTGLVPWNSKVLGVSVRNPERSTS